MRGQGLVALEIDAIGKALLSKGSSFALRKVTVALAPAKGTVVIIV